VTTTIDRVGGPMFRHGEVLPTRRFATPMWLRVSAYFAYQYKRTWRSSMTTSFLIPVLYLTSMGVALGSLINKHSHGVAGVSYISFLAPGLLASTCMQIAMNDTSWPVLGAIKWMRTYHAMLATPVSVRDVQRGHLAWVAARIGIVVTIYLAVMAAFNTIHSLFAIVALPAAIMTGLAFGAPMAAFAATRDKDTPFITIYRFVVVPLFLFSGTFFPISQLPKVLQWIAYATPLYHGVALCRDLTLGTITGWPDVGHAAYLALWIIVGLVVGARTYAKRLVV
jgi:lipooligosaccharide transport system permease protein